MKKYTRHGHSGNIASKTYNTWRNMHARCNRPTSVDYQWYGGRGIRICERWNEFTNFLADMGERAENTILDRIDSNGNYEPSNCRWLTKAESSLNKRVSRYYTFLGQRHHLVEWAKILGVNKETLFGRFDRGWSAERALTEMIISFR